MENDRGAVFYLTGHLNRKLGGYVGGCSVIHAWDDGGLD